MSRKNSFPMSKWQDFKFPGYDPSCDAGDCKLDEDAGNKAIDFFPTHLVHVKGPLTGKAFVLMPWQQAIVGHLFAWKRPDGTRRYREAFIEVARKNGKSILGAGIALYTLFCDGEPGPEIYSAAGDRQQASIVFEMSQLMVMANEKLRDMAEVYRREIRYPKINGRFVVISSEAASKHGFNSHVVICDELHIWPNRELLDALITSMGARTQPLIISITTAGWDPHSIWHEKLQYATKVRDGTIKDSSFLPVIYAANLEDDWKSVDTWRKANPNLDVSISREYLARECQRAIDTPGYENSFKRLHLNIRTEQEERWIPMDHWDKCKEAVNLQALAGRQCYGGFDLSARVDVTALVLVFPPEQEDGKYEVLPFFWIPEETMKERIKRDRVPYDQWVRMGLVTPSPGNATDYRLILDKIREIDETYKLEKLAFDPYGILPITNELGETFGDRLFEFRQGWKTMSPACKDFQVLVINERLKHGGNPVLRWMASNFVVKVDHAANVVPDKPSAAQKIDGIVALIMALDTAEKRRVSPHSSIYDDQEQRPRGIIVIGGEDEQEEARAEGWEED